MKGWVKSWPRTLQCHRGSRAGSAEGRDRCGTPSRLPNLAGAAVIPATITGASGRLNKSPARVEARRSDRRDLGGRRLASQGGVDPPGRRLGAPRVQVGVDVQRGRVVGMAEHLRDDRELLACGEEKRGAGVAKVVDPDGTNASLRRRVRERAPKRPRGGGGAAADGEDDLVGVRPARARRGVGLRPAANSVVCAISRRTRRGNWVLASTLSLHRSRSSASGSSAKTMCVLSCVGAAKRAARKGAWSRAREEGSTGDPVTHEMAQRSRYRSLSDSEAH